MRVDEPAVVVGAGLAGSRTCLELRRCGYTGPVVLIGDETELPYDRPPLSKAVVAGKREPKPLKADYAGLDIDVRLGTRVEDVDLGAGRLQTSSGAISFGHLVIATGATPLTLPGAGQQLTLRTAADAIALRDRLVPGAHLVVVGASWIGAEVAHAAIQRGCTVTGLEYHPAPLTQAIGPEIGARIARWWAASTLRTSVQVAAVEADGVHLDTGEVISADTVVTGIGVRAATDWLDGTGLDLLPAVQVDEHLRASHPGVYAVGDAAAWWSRRFGRRLDVQHWDDAYTAPTVVASTIVHGEAAELIHDPVPYFWSDQFGHRLEYIGHHDVGDTVSIDDAYETGWTAQWTNSYGRVTAALTVDQSKLIAQWRKELFPLGVAATAE